MRKNPTTDGAPAETPAFPAEKAAKFRRALAEWFARERRNLPWRRERSVFSAVVSEFMLQQTTVAAVIPYFENWMRRWKNFDELARADVQDVLRAWEGLGYYSRAKNLHALAQRIAAAKRIPASVAEWRDFRGIGAYTAAAIASIAQGIPAAVVDGNVVRILARISGDERVFRDASAAAAEFAALADALLDRANPGTHNEAMMELGALVCSRRAPRCTSCPVRDFCAANARGNAETLPRFVPKKMKKREVERLLCRRGNALLLVRRTAGTRRLRDICEFPLAADFRVPARIRKSWKIVFEGRRGIADELIRERFRLVPANAAETLAETFRREAGTHAFFAEISALDTLVFSGPHRKWLAALTEKTA